MHNYIHTYIQYSHPVSLGAGIAETIELGGGGRHEANALLTGRRVEIIQKPNRRIRITLHFVYLLYMHAFIHTYMVHTYKVLWKQYNTYSTFTAKPHIHT